MKMLFEAYGGARHLWILLVSVSTLVVGCVPVDDSTDPDAAITLDFNDATQRRIYGLQDRLAADSLVSYLDAQDPTHRYLAAQAFGSVMSDSAIGPLTRVLLDPIDRVRAAAAYALGQQGAARAQGPLLQAFDARDTAGVYARANGSILEAIGKVGDTTMLRNLASVSTYLPSDTILALGQVRGIYRFMSRGITSPQATALMVERATDRAWPSAVRVLAAHYLQRGDLSLAGYGERLLTAYDEEGESAVRMALSRALGKTENAQLGSAISQRFLQEESPMVRVELVRALGRMPYESARPALLRAIQDDNFLVAETAGSVLAEAGQPEDATLYWRLAKDSTTADAARIALYGAALSTMPSYLQEYRGYVNTELRRAYLAEVDPYVRGDILRALSRYPWNFRFLIEQLRDPEEASVTKTVAAEALLQIAQRDDIIGYFRSSFPTVRREYASYITDVLSGNDAGRQAVAASTLALPDWQFGTVFNDIDLLLTAKQRLKLPRDTETAYAIEDARAALVSGYEANKPEPGYNHDINWDIYRSLQPGLEVVLETPRGSIVMDLFEQTAPATVINFVQLVRNGFFNGKRFHRVVPAFVTQGGGPRGDGYGSLDYTLRTETPAVYYDAPGYVGMASAGRHTEGVQFFFTHQATPHLDGRYTIFGRVTEGLDVVTSLRRGDDMRVRLR